MKALEGVWRRFCGDIEFDTIRVIGGIAHNS